MSDPHLPELGTTAQNRIQNIRGVQVQALLAKLDVLLPHLPDFPLQELESSEDYTKGEANGKHVLQEVSIIGHLRLIQALEGAQVAIELGAGTGRLSDRLQRTTNSQLQHILVDRQSFEPNQTRDRAMITRGKRPDCVQRLVMDVASLDLGQYNNKKCFCMSKHLCGPACDLAIVAFSRTAIRPPCALATCCHYLCTWESFVGCEFWLCLGLSEKDFEVAVTASQWASMKKQAKDTTRENNLNDYTLPNLAQIAAIAGAALKEHTLPQPTLSSDEFERTFSRQEKVALGIQCKRLLDLARAAHLQKLGYKVKLVRYTTKSVEDRLVLAWMMSE
jgi:tRNA:m4X modification enzyme